MDSISGLLWSVFLPWLCSSNVRRNKTATHSKLSCPAYSDYLSHLLFGEAARKQFFFSIICFHFSVSLHVNTSCDAGWHWRAFKFLSQRILYKEGSLRRLSIYIQFSFASLYRAHCVIPWHSPLEEFYAERSSEMPLTRLSTPFPLSVFQVHSGFISGR